MRVRILRQESPTAEPYWESFDYDGPRETSVAALLDHLNFHDDLVNDAVFGSLCQQFLGLGLLAFRAVGFLRIHAVGHRQQRRTPGGLHLSVKPGGQQECHQHSADC